MKADKIEKPSVYIPLVGKVMELRKILGKPPPLVL